MTNRFFLYQGRPGIGCPSGSAPWAGGGGNGAGADSGGYHLPSLAIHQPGPPL